MEEADSLQTGITMLSSHFSQKRGEVGEQVLLYL
jgi:hypothetical protein